MGTSGINLFGGQIVILDISHYQGAIDWDLLAQELDFVILRATYGMAKDSRYQEYAKECARRGVPFGTYHYLKASDKQTAVEEASFFFEAASSEAPIFYVMDTEHDNQTQQNSSEIFKAFVSFLRGKGVKKIGVYANRKYPYIEKDLGIVDFVWVPRYGKDTGYPDKENYPPRYPCDLWQYTSKGKAPGVQSYVDMNQLYGDKTMEWFTDREEKEEDSMAVIIGSARIDENGKAHGGQAGDQTGKEVSTQNWYKHSKGWVVLRAKDPSVAQKIAIAMQHACDNPNIGYDQYQNQTLWNEVKDKGYDPAKAGKPCETDCARLVRVCVAYAGIIAKDFYTATEVDKLMETGAFVKLTSSKYTGQSSYLGAGDILVTKTKGHTAVVLTNGSKYDGNVEEPKIELGSRILRNGDEGTDVEDLQKRLKAAGYDPGEIDGEYGPNTEASVKALQKDAGILVDGEFGADSLKALVVLEVDKDDTGQPDNNDGNDAGLNVIVAGGNAFIRTGPSTQYDKAGVARSGEKYAYGNPDNWVPILLDGRLLWISGKYAKIS